VLKAPNTSGEARCPNANSAEQAEQNNTQFFMVDLKHTLW
jgi:hypothetical protein